ncbi:uncharacterized protein LOC131631972 [Vicia villosa]|uniref:uncharacterized protein LOC131631972 n=1 Tax=Vicia villosa TaxID=3911 RepID=UPI00273BE312|nr:uncharacterized protein LOC131631972 [Vicia villosa]
MVFSQGNERKENKSYRSPTKNFDVGKGLIQDDPLSPFLFVSVAEGLTGLVRQSIAVGEFESFCIQGSCKVDILQFVNDTLLVAKGTWKHVWAIKAVLRAFELVSGLGINYHKTSSVLSCKVEDSKFHFLGIPVGFNPRKEETWIPLVLEMKNWLAGWKNRFSLHNGFNTHFWEVKWLDGKLLKEEFPGLFEASSLKGVLVAVMGGWMEGEWRWGDLGVLESIMDNSDLMAELGALCESFGGLGEGKDVVERDLNREEGFSVASCYEAYACMRTSFGPPCRFDKAKGIVWKSEVPFKIKAFGWRLIANMLLTRDLLVYRGISIPFDHLKCSFYGIDLENRDHFFFACSLVKDILREMAFWIGKLGLEEEECLSSLMD